MKEYYICKAKKISIHISKKPETTIETSCREFPVALKIHKKEYSVSNTLIQ